MGHAPLDAYVRGALQGWLASAAHSAILAFPLDEARQARGAEGIAHRCALLQLCGRLYMGRGELERAERLLAEAKEHSRRHLGDTHAHFFSCAASLGAIRRAQGRLEEATALYTELLPRCRAALLHCRVAALPHCCVAALLRCLPLRL